MAKGFEPNHRLQIEVLIKVGRRYPKACPPCGLLATGPLAMQESSGEMGEKDKQSNLSIVKRGRTGDVRVERNIERAPGRLCPWFRSMQLQFQMLGTSHNLPFFFSALKF